MEQRSYAERMKISKSVKKIRGLTTSLRNGRENQAAQLRRCDKIWDDQVLHPACHEACKDYRYDGDRHHTGDNHLWHDVLQKNFLLFHGFTDSLGHLVWNNKGPWEAKKGGDTQSKGHVPVEFKNLAHEDGN